MLKLSWDESNADASPRNFHAISFRITGNARYTVKETELTVRDGSLLFVPENVGYHITSQKEELYVIHFELPEKIQTHLELLHIEDCAKTRKLFENCYEIWTKKEPGYYYKVLSIFYQILALLSVSRFNQQTDNMHQRLKPAMDYLHAHYTDPDINVLMLCRLTDLSDTWFRKLFASCYKTTPIKYINTLRIEYAKELLESGYYKVETVAEMTGFEDPKYFSTLFKQYTGQAPSQFRSERV